MKFRTQLLNAINKSIAASRQKKNTFHLPSLLQYLPQQVQQPTRYLSGLTFRVLPLLAVRQVGLLNIQVLRLRTVDSQLLTSGTHQLISFLHALPEQFLIGRIAHLALIASSIREHRVQILHVRLPCRRQQVLQFLDLQASGQFRSDAIQQFVVRQRMRRINQDVTEHLVVNVSVQRLHQLRKTHLRLHLQEHQRHFPIWGEVGLPSTSGHHALAHQPEALGHLTQREELLHPAQFSLFKSLSVKFIKIELRERKIWCNLSKVSYPRHTNF